MDYSLIILIIACLGAFFMAFNNGANDVANAFASAVGSKAITIKQALFIAATLNMVGGILLGSHVASTLIEGVIKSGLDVDPMHYIAGMICCLIASGTFVLFSTLTGMPVSSTHAIVGSLTGIAIALGGFGAVNWSIFSVIVMSWVISPFMAGFIAFASIRIIKKLIYKSREHKILHRMSALVPIFTALSGGILAFSILKQSHWAVDFELSMAHMMEISLLCTGLAYVFLRLLLKAWCINATRNEKGAESVFRKLQVGSSCYVAFAHGANDVSNSISPVLAIFMVMKMGKIPGSFGPMEIPLWILLLGAGGMGLGTWILGHKVMATLGNKITLITNSRGFCIDFSTATTVVVATIFGMPVSSTHAATGSVIGVGLENKKSGGLNIHLLGKILLAWIITVPSAALLTILLYSIVRWLFL